MANKYLDQNGLLYFWQKIKNKFVNDANYVHTDNNYTNSEKTAVATIGDKVDKVAGKGLSTEDYTTAEKSKLAGIDDGAEANVQVDWSQTTTTADDYIKNKPTIPTKTSDLTNDSDFVTDTDLDTKVDKETGKGLSTNDYNTTDKGKVDKLAFNGNVIDESILPSYVDDVVEAYPISEATELSAGWLSKTSGGSALTPESGVIYILMAASTNYEVNTQFRWGGTTYVKLADSGLVEITNAEIDTIVAS